ncbi:uncharacterized protein LOC142559570 [Dermacentor variabilis]|uniref:uncharacterized protein LOC142559570 n=1 Tax=Dermacentor variabilis TaxID=34621 RepID=UPI003F5AF21D
MDPRFYRETEPFVATSASEDARARWRSEHRWPDAAAAREVVAAPFHEQIEVPSWDSEVFAGHGRAPHVAPVWETWLSSDGAAEEEDGTASSGSSASPCRHYSKRDGDSDSTPSSDTQTFSAEGRTQSWAAAPSNLRLVGLTALAALLVCAVVATNAKINRIVLASLDTESPDETRQAKLVNRKLSATEPGLPVSLLPDSAHGDLMRPGEPRDDDAVPTAIASDSEQSNTDAYTAAGEGAGPPGVTRSRIPDASAYDLGDGGDVGRTAEETPGRSYRRTNKPDCQAVVYTYCPVARREFHYRASVNACLATALDPMLQLCARGSNRFASRANCEHSCVFGYRPKDACFDTPLFSGCDRQDVSETSWYFEGGRCHLWSFPAGACPSNDSAVFSTAAECASRCAGGSRPGFPPCRAPRPTACGRSQLRFPFFAHFSSAGGRMRCLRASAVLDAGHRCLAGDNRFASLADCVEACAKTTRQ